MGKGENSGFEGGGLDINTNCSCVILRSVSDLDLC